MARKAPETIFEHTGSKGQSGKLQIDSAGRLYWNDERVSTEVRLTSLQTLGAAITVISAGLGGVLALLNIIDWFG